jgi:hypothetical protein
MLRAARDMGKAEFSQIVGDDALGTRNPKALADYSNQINAPPSYNTMDLPVWAEFDNLRQFQHLLIAQQTPSSGTLPVGQTIRAIFVEAMHPIPQRLTVHPPNPRRLCPVHTVVNSGQRKQPAYLAVVTTSTRKPTQGGSIIITTKRYGSRHGKSPLPW